VALAAGFGARARAGLPIPAATRLLAPVAFTPLRVATRLPLRTSWPALADARSYRARVTPAGGGAPLGDQIVNAPEATWGDLPDGTHTLTVRGIDAQGLEGLEASAPLPVDARPFPPIVRLPADAGAVYADRIRLAWARPEGATSFDLQVAATPEFATLAVERLGQPALEAEVSLPPGRYVWRVASRQGDDRGPWGDPVPFELRALPAAGPPPDAQIRKKELTLRWSASTAGDRFGVQMASDAGFTTLLVDTVVPVPELTIPRPLKGLYHVRVRLVNADGIDGPYGPTQTFDVPRPPRSKWWWLLLVPAAAGPVVAAF
jgi:hypothetical protein